MNHRRIAALAIAATLAIAACGDDEPVEDLSARSPAANDDADSATDGDGDTSLNSPSDGPRSTVPPDLPDSLIGSIGPVDVIGDPLPPLPDGGADPARGAPAPVLVGEDFDGRTVRIDAVAAGPTMVVFLAHWCPHCNDEIPVINGLRDDGRLPASLNVVGISTSVAPDRPNFPPSEWLDRRDWQFPVMADGVDFDANTLVAANAFGVTGFPFVALLDADGTVAARWSGGLGADAILSLITSSLELG
ncbi:MAG: TlpA disulfide reductase family protein [Ilumatobacter sp.]|uniref:TlpA family protein disulfide reductase n=1 Tax=Ilumatobacter sp. TaxID=1967498 RepID=UPI0026237FA5|nr:TlpA disulfide reductase family protein [Ilumatobacter sp.]MDJ0770368.1 TlpA disulfide reductase family protein [Ilumatobacter sp.]